MDSSNYSNVIRDFSGNPAGHQCLLIAVGPVGLVALVHHFDNVRNRLITNNYLQLLIRIVNYYLLGEFLFDRLHESQCSSCQLNCSHQS